MIRIAADGTQIGRNLTVLNISFSILNKIKNSGSGKFIESFNYNYMKLKNLFYLFEKMLEVVRQKMIKYYIILITKTVIFY